MLCGDSAPAPFIFIATGTGATVESAGHTALASENTSNGAQRVQATCTFVSPGTSQWSYLFAFSGSVIIRELGIFNALVGGTMLLRHVLSDNKNFSDGESVEITITNTMLRAS